MTFDTPGPNLLMTYRDQKDQIDIAVLDFSKAFDTVPHDRMLGKLEFYGITGPVLNWTAAFFKNRVQRVMVDGRQSRSATVDSGVPQGTVLGPLLFLLHINDLPSVVDSQVRLFADDCLVYRPIRSEADQVLLQRDLSALELWGDTWGMRFNATKCNIMRISRSRNPLTRMYSLCNHVLSEVDTAKYLGINQSSELSWSPHVSSVVSKANSTLGFLRRNLRKCPSKLKETAYLSLVRSTLEYAVTIWDPYYIRDIDSLEQVQRRAARFTTGDYHTTSSITAMLAELGWKRLEDRRKDLRLALLYKIVHGHVAVPVDALNLEPPDLGLVRSINIGINIWPHIRTHTNIFFLCRTIPEWDSLPASAVEATSVESFKTHLAGRPQRDQSWSATPTHPWHTPEEDCGLRYQTRPNQRARDAIIILLWLAWMGQVEKLGVDIQDAWTHGHKCMDTWIHAGNDTTLSPKLASGKNLTNHRLK